jgi:small subunit ribosomal protein S21
MVTVIPRKDEPFERALRRCRREVEKAGILKTTKARKYYEKPSERKKKKARAARKRRIRKVRRLTRGSS